MAFDKYKIFSHISGMPLDPEVHSEQPISCLEGEINHHTVTVEAPNLYLLHPEPKLRYRMLIIRFLWILFSEAIHQGLLLRYTWNIHFDQFK